MKIFSFLFSLGIINTLRLNFGYLPFKEAIKFPILASKRLYIYSLQGTLKLDVKRFGTIRLGFGNVGIFDRRYQRSIWEVGRNAEIVFRSNAVLGQGFRLCVLPDGKLIIGQRFNLTANSTIICQKKIEIGNDNLFSWDILLMDTDFHPIYNSNSEINSPQEISIGSKVWLGCRSTILKGSNIADGSIIAAGSIVIGQCNQPRSIYGGNPAHLLKSDVDWKK